MNDKDKNLAELEATEREQDRKRQEHEQKRLEALDDPRVRLGIDALMEDWIARTAATLSNANAAQLHRLAQRLVALGLIDLDEPDEEIEIGHINDLVTGEIVVAIAPGESVYWEAGTTLMEQQERPDGVWVRRLDDEGEPVEEWKRVAAPPPSTASTN